jgi:PKD repeat protein
LYRVTYNTTSHVPVAARFGGPSPRAWIPSPCTSHSAGSTDPDGDPLSYLWTFGDGTNSTEANPSKTYANKGVYTARLTVAAAGDSVQAQPIVVQVGIPPSLIVASPTEGQTYRAGDTISWNAFANDAAGFDINDANIKTVVRLHHGTHFHPFLGPVSGRAGSFTVPTTGEASADTSYEITITATDANGLGSSKTINVFPLKSQMTFATTPPGLGLTLDGVPISTPRVVEGVIGFNREIAAPATAITADGTVMEFAGWSDGRNIRHVITTPETDTTYTAVYQPSAPFTASYFNNPTLSGTPVLTRQDPTVDFNWDQGSPDPAVDSNNFSVRWTKTQAFGAGRYKFTTVTDDGVRLYIDNIRVIDHWEGQSSTEWTYTADLGQGNHTVRMEYFDFGGAAVADLRWEATVDQPNETWHAEYWNMIGMPVIPSGSPLVAREELAIDHDWGTGSPAPGIINTNLFLARWSRVLNVAPGEYQFVATADDGVRLFVDGVMVIDRWIDQGATSYPVTLPLDGGPHTVVMEYYESGGGAVAKLSYSQVGELPESAGWEAEYWNTPEVGLGAPPVIPTRPADLTRTEPVLENEWYDGSPDPSISNNFFMARWTRTDVLSAGVYRFSGAADDGIRVYVDNTPVIDMWQLQNATFSVDKVVLAGSHVVRVEYFENGSNARAIVNYTRVGEVVPQDPGFSAEYFANQDLGWFPGRDPPRHRDRFRLGQRFAG